MLATGTRLVYEGQWKVPFKLTDPPSQYLQQGTIPQLTSVLADSYDITLEQSHANPSIFGPSNVQLSLLLNADYGQESDVLSIIKNEAESTPDPVTVVSGDFTGTTQPGDSPESTGAPSLDVGSLGVDPVTGQAAPKPCTWIDSLTGNTSCVPQPGGLSLSSKITLGVVGLVAFVLVLVFLLPGHALELAHGAAS